MKSTSIVIDPVTRIEGHGKISVFLDAQGEVSDARFHVVEYRGFEKFCLGRPYYEMPAITARICGICPVSHHLAAARACDKILAVKLPPAGHKLRRLLNAAQFTQSHALSFFHLSSPDFLLGWDSDPALRNVVGLIQADPGLAKKAIVLRQYGQKILEILGAKRIHTSWVVPGGVASPLSAEGRDWIARNLPEAAAIAEAGMGILKKLLDKSLQEEVGSFGNFPSLFMGLVNPDGTWDHHGGRLKVVDAHGKTVADNLDEDRYLSFIEETVEPYSYMKFPHWKALGPEKGVYRVGPLARLNVCTGMGSPKADKELAEFRSRAGGTVALSSFFYHYARLVEITACLEQIQALVDDPEILSTRVRAEAGVNALEGVGVTEAPRGTLLHHYRVDDTGRLTHVNLIVSTGHNNRAMNRTVAQIAKHFIHKGDVREGLLNRVEGGIRCYDPCLSCATHALGRMPLQLKVFAADGSLVHTQQRDG